MHSRSTLTLAGTPGIGGKLTDTGGTPGIGGKLRQCLNSLAPSLFLTQSILKVSLKRAAW